MANRIRGITVEIGGDTTKLAKALEGVNKNIKSTQTQLKDVEKLLKLDPTNTELLSQKQKLLADAVSSTTGKLETLKKASEEAAKTKDNYDAWKAKYDSIKQKISETETKLKDLKEQSKTADEQLSKGEISQEKYDALQREIKDTSDELASLKQSAKDVSDEFGNPISPEQYLDLIITKSISRFARNTVTLLETVRELKDLGVDVFFEEQNIHSLSSDGELMLSILASYAQEESYSASENKKWQIRRDFEQGKIGGIVMLGYRRTKDGSLEIIPEEAKIVRMIFEDYLGGMGKLAIANQLNEQGILTKNGNQWSPESVLRILKNEKYAGTMILQKYYSENHITKRKMTNEGQLQKYMIDESHPAIIERRIFDAVQKRLQEQKEYFTLSKSTTTIYPFTGKIQCQCCGKNYRRKTTATGVVWICATYNTKGKKYCPTAKQIPESTLISTCCEVLGISEFDADIFRSQINKILVSAPNELIFVFTDFRIVMRFLKIVG